ncbi:guanine nucleotide-binding protein subunit beta-like protein 1 [Haliotis rubra]|uniref:guanine nucleotide-binding protein subunit beta-like protein 1 n=1 Tax=Haliotis rubra TaxID=36100 RepID=UPI001EE5D2E7|nr:guanine nucleotide-binding protein subunit beta-like protein 1 [Haliotis rubra]
MASPPPDPSFILRGASSPITSLAFSTPQTLYSGTLDGKVLQWSLDTRRVQSTVDDHAGHTVLWVCPLSEECLLSQGRDGFVKSWQYGDGSLTNTGHMRCATMGFCGSSVVLRNNSQLVATPSEAASQVDVYDIHTKHCVMSLKPDCSSQKVGICMSIKTASQSEGNQILIGYENGSITLWDLRTQKCASTLDRLHGDSVMCMGFSANSRKGISGSVDKKLICWSVDAESHLEKTSELDITNPGLNDIVVRTDEKIVACAGWDNNIRLFSWKKIKPLAVLSYHRDSAQCLAFSQDNLLACGSKDQLISVWDIYR